MTLKIMVRKYSAAMFHKMLQVLENFILQCIVSEEQEDPAEQD